MPLACILQILSLLETLQDFSFLSASRAGAVSISTHCGPHYLDSGSPRHPARRITLDMVDSLWAFPCPFCHGLCDVRCMWDARLGSLAAVRSMMQHGYIDAGVCLQHGLCRRVRPTGWHWCPLIETCLVVLLVTRLRTWRRRPLPRVGPQSLRAALVQGRWQVGSVTELLPPP